MTRKEAWLGCQYYNLLFSFATGLFGSVSTNRTNHFQETQQILLTLEDRVIAHCCIAYQIRYDSPHLALVRSIQAIPVRRDVESCELNDNTSAVASGAVRSCLCSFRSQGTGTGAARPVVTNTAAE